MKGKDAKHVIKVLAAFTFSSKTQVLAVCCISHVAMAPELHPLLHTAGSYQVQICFGFHLL